MFSEKAFQAWRAQRGAVEDADRARIRELAGAEVDAVIAQVRREREAEVAQEQLARSLRHATAVRQMGRPAPAETTEQHLARRAEIRRGVEAEMRQFDAERQRATRATEPTQQTRAASAPKIGDVRSYGSHGRFRWDGARWAHIGPAAA